jgi:hypothetical protein
MNPRPTQFQLPIFLMHAMFCEQSSRIEIEIGVVLVVRIERSLLVTELTLFAAAIAAFIVMNVPASAQSYDPSAGSGNVVPVRKAGCVLAHLRDRYTIMRLRQVGYRHRLRY